MSWWNVLALYRYTWILTAFSSFGQTIQFEYYQPRSFILVMYGAFDSGTAKSAAVTYLLVHFHLHYATGWSAWLWKCDRRCRKWWQLVRGNLVRWLPDRKRIPLWRIILGIELVSAFVYRKSNVKRAGLQSTLFHSQKSQNYSRISHLPISPA